MGWGVSDDEGLPEGMEFSFRSMVVSNNIVTRLFCNEPFTDFKLTRRMSSKTNAEKRYTYKIQRYEPKIRTDRNQK